MRYSLKRKLLSFGGDSMIKDEHGQDMIFVDGAAISIGRKITLKDMQGNELCLIHQQLIAFTPTFEIHVTGGVTAKMSLKLLTLTDRLKIDVSGAEDMEAHGNLFHREYHITRGGREVAEVSKRWFTMTESYGVEIADGEDQILLLACAVVIDEILEMKEHADHE